MKLMLMASTKTNLNNLNFIGLESQHAFRQNYNLLLLASKILAVGIPNKRICVLDHFLSIFFLIIKSTEN